MRHLACVLLLGCGGAAAAPVAPPVIEVEPEQSEPVRVSSSADAPSSDTDESCRREIVEATHLTHRDGPDARLFRAALNAQAKGRMEDARKKLLELTESYRKSPFVPHAYLLFGEFFFEEAEKDPSKWRIAEQFYRETAKYPFPEHRTFLYAQLRLGDVHRALGNDAEAMSSYRLVFMGPAQHPDAPCVDAFVDEARAELIASYAKVGAPRKAHTFFVQLTGSDAEAFAMDADLAGAYAAAGKKPEAETVLHEAVQRSPDTASCAALVRVKTEHGLSASLQSACP